jgi:hypothetical protein
MFNRADGAMNALSFYAAVSICRERGSKNWLQDVHGSMVSNPVRVVRQPEYDSFLRLVDCECSVGRSPVSFVQKHFLQGHNIGITTPVMNLNALLKGFTLPRPGICQLQVLDRTNTFI